MKQNSIGSLLLAAATVCGGCSRGSSSGSLADGGVVVDTLYISASGDFYDEAVGRMPSPEFVILKEDDATMYSEITRLVDAYGKYFVLDSWSSRKLVAFDHQGNPVASFGKRGNGPGEFVIPNDVFVDSQYVYLANGPGHAILKYDHKGNYLSKLDAPFYPEAFVKLANGNFLFSFSHAEMGKSFLSITDSLMNPVKDLIPFPENYVGGWGTGNPFRMTDKEIIFYSSPSDTIYHLDMTGEIIGKTILQFEHGPVNELAKLDYIKADEQGLLKEGGMQLSDNPVYTADGLGFGSIREAGNYNYLIFDKKSGKSGVRKYGDRMSAFSLVSPTAIGEGGRLICHIDPMIMDDLADIESLPDSVRDALADGCKVLTIF